MPLWIKALSGNTRDKKGFSKTVQVFQKQFDRKTMPYMVMDSAFYSKKNLDSCRELRRLFTIFEDVLPLATHGGRTNEKEV